MAAERDPSKKYHQDWGRIPRFCKQCLWYEVQCFICPCSLRVCREWDKPPKAHKECLAKYAPKSVTCRECGQTFTVSTGLQLKCNENGWSLPTKCPQCKDDALLIAGALGAARERFRFPLKAVVEPRGILFPSKVAVIFNRITGEAVAEVQMENRGFILQVREAVLRDRDGKVVSRTRDGREGIVFDRRVAETFDQDLAQRTHRTREKEEGVIFRRRVRETENLDTGQKTKVRPGSEGLLNPKSVHKTGK